MPEFSDLTAIEKQRFFNQHTTLGSRGIELLNALDTAATDKFLSDESRAEKVQNIEKELIEVAATVISPTGARAAVEAEQAGE